MACLTPEQIDVLARHPERPSIPDAHRHHVEECDVCRQRLDEYRADEDLLEQLRRLGGSGLLQGSTGASGGGDGVAGQPILIPGYRVVRELHRGGQGVVYEAIQAGTEMPVAIKVLLGGPFISDRARWRFEQEAKLIAALRHPNIVVIHASGIAHGKYYFVMEYVRGHPLDTHARLSKLRPRQIVELFTQVCGAVAYAHRRGVIHRDLKPSNILVGEDGTPRILDFGLAKILDEGEKHDRPVVTVTGQIMGTLPYMSPEQTSGELETVDTRTDVYSLGVILYEMLTGAPPYPTTGLELLSAIRNIREVDPSRPSKVRNELNSEIDAMILKAMAKEPGRRYQSAAELGEDLQAWLDGRPVTARSDSALYVLRKIAVRHSFQTTIVTALLAAVISFGAITFHAYRQAAAALQQQQLSEESERIAYKGMARFEAEGQNALRTQALGWFLLEWHAGRLDRAREIMAQVYPASPEYPAMGFLLDEKQTPADLQARLPSSADALLRFVIGEWHLKAKRVPEAIAEYEAAAVAARPPYGWFGRSAEARLRQLRGQPAATGSAPAVPNEKPRGGS